MILTPHQHIASTMHTTIPSSTGSTPRATSTSLIQSIVVIDDAVASTYWPHVRCWTCTATPDTINENNITTPSAANSNKCIGHDSHELNGIINIKDVIRVLNESTEPQLSKSLRWYNAWQLDYQFRLIGIKASHCQTIIASIFDHISNICVISSTLSLLSSIPSLSTTTTTPASQMKKHVVADSLQSLGGSCTAMTSSLFHHIITTTCARYRYVITSSHPATISTSPNIAASATHSSSSSTSPPSSTSRTIDPEHWALARSISEHRRCYIILLSGTSGTGKSTLASLLADRLRISTVISTDSIRHMLRHTTDSKQHPALFVSTYQAADTITTPGYSHAKRVRLGYKQQCRLVTAQLDHMIHIWSLQQTSVIVEGVHLSLPWMLKALRRHPNVIMMPFLVYISNAVKHRERFAVRAKSMTLDAGHNKYVQYFPNIRIIQKYLFKRATRALVPRIDNTSVDRSLAALHTLILRGLRHVAHGRSLLDLDEQMTFMHQEWESTQGSAWSSKAMQRTLAMRVEKQGLFNRLFGHSATIPPPTPSIAADQRDTKESTTAPIVARTLSMTVEPPTPAAALFSPTAPIITEDLAERIRDKRLAYKRGAGDEDDIDSGTDTESEHGSSTSSTAVTNNRMRGGGAPSLATPSERSRRLVFARPNTGPDNGGGGGNSSNAVRVDTSDTPSLSSAAATPMTPFDINRHFPPYHLYHHGHAHTSIAPINPNMSSSSSSLLCSRIRSASTGQLTNMVSSSPSLRSTATTIQPASPPPHSSPKATVSSPPHQTIRFESIDRTPSLEDPPSLHNTSPAMKLAITTSDSQKSPPHDSTTNLLASSTTQSTTNSLNRSPASAIPVLGRQRSGSMPSLSLTRSRSFSSPSPPQLMSYHTCPPSLSHACPIQAALPSLPADPQASLQDEDNDDIMMNNNTTNDDSSKPQSTDIAGVDSGTSPIWWLRKPDHHANNNINNNPATAAAASTSSSTTTGVASTNRYNDLDARSLVSQSTDYHHYDDHDDDDDDDTVDEEDGNGADIDSHSDVTI